jgi:16S rRNA processing protein RimM
VTAERVCVGAIAGAFGVRGEVRLKSFCAEPEAIATYGPLQTEDGSRSFRVTLTRPVAGGLGARLSGVATKEAADALRGTRLYADRARLPDPDADEFYHADLIGMEVRDTGGTLLGRVEAVHNHGAGDLLEVAGPAPGASMLLPFTRAAVPTVDLAARRIVADLPDGLAEGSGPGEGPA